MEALRFRRTSIHGSRSGAATSYRALRAHNHGEVDATHIIVDVKNGEVTLTGTVEDRRTKRLAEDAVETVTGVKDVQNQLRIMDARTSMPATDKKQRPS